MCTYIKVQIAFWINLYLCKSRFTKSAPMFMKKYKKKTLVLRKYAIFHIEKRPPKN